MLLAVFLVDLFLLQVIDHQPAVMAVVALAMVAEPLVEIDSVILEEQEEYIIFMTQKTLLMATLGPVDKAL